MLDLKSRKFALSWEPEAFRSPSGIQSSCCSKQDKKKNVQKLVVSICASGGKLCSTRCSDQLGPLH